MCQVEKSFLKNLEIKYQSLSKIIYQLCHFYFLSLALKSFVFSNFGCEKIIIVGGQHLHVEPISYVSLKKNTQVWDIFNKGGIISFFKIMNGCDKDLSSYFMNIWINGRVVVGGVRVWSVMVKHSPIYVRRNLWGVYFFVLGGWLEAKESPDQIYYRISFTSIGSHHLSLPKYFMLEGWFGMVQVSFFPS